ncbi:MAG: ABC transporter permease [Crocinitomicaceae bacterium]|nr:ABC transporter permease [Crocinitomicaceae bacterium]
MRQLLAAIKKETLLLVRDRIGLAILFIMPMVLIFVMTIIQDAAFRTLNEQGIPIVLVNADQDSLGNRIEFGLSNTDLCVLHTEIDGEIATLETVRKAVQEGQFLIGIIIPEGATDAIENNVSSLVSASLGMEDETVGAQSAEIQLIIDPVAAKSFVVSITSRLREFISGVKARIMFETFNTQIAELIPEDLGVETGTYNGEPIITYAEEYASELTGDVQPNAVQHNVPAWTIFSMFFIVLPLVSSMMKEKEEGTVFRFHTIPTSYFLQIIAKIFVYIIVCMMQFFLMISIGLFALPLIGLPELELGNSYSGILLIALGCSIAATGYGVLVGTLATTQQQGSILGSLSILVLSAIGGIWVPAYIMPDTMRTLSEMSPLHWGLDGFYGLFLRGEGIGDMIPHFLKMLIFFVVCIGLTIGVQRFKRRG